MIPKILLYLVGIGLNLYVANKKQGPIKKVFYFAAGLWALVGVLDISGILN